MKILMTADTVGGVWQYALELARALSSHEVDVVLATMGRRLDEAQRRSIAAVPNVELHESDFRLEWMPDPWEDVERAGRWLLDLEARHSPDVVHLNGYVHGALPWARPVLIVGHSCVLSWWAHVHGSDAPPDWNRYRRMVAAGIAGADAVVAPTRAMLGELVRRYAADRHGARLSVIPNGRCASRFAPERKEPFVFTAGRLWDEAKNVAALAAIADQLPWPVFVAGEVGASCAPVLHPLGPLSESEMAACFGRASIYAHPARYEPFGLAVLEAALAGCALVLGDIASLRELWRGAAVFVAPADRVALAEALRDLASDPVQRARLGACARKRALRYSPENMAESYHVLYERMLDGEPRESAPVATIRSRGQAARAAEAS